MSNSKHLDDGFARGLQIGVALGASLAAAATLWSRLWAPLPPRTTPETAALAITDPAAAIRNVVHVVASSPSAFAWRGTGAERALRRAPSRHLA